jgi:hypothetical protein
LSLFAGEEAQKTVKWKIQEGKKQQHRNGWKQNLLAQSRAGSSSSQKQQNGKDPNFSLVNYFALHP